MKRTVTNGISLGCLNKSLLIAVAQGRVEDAAELIERGASAEARDHRGRTPLMIAALSGDGGMVKMLLERGADPAAKSVFRHVGSTETLEGHTALRYAMMGGCRAVVAMLLGALALEKAA